MNKYVVLLRGINVGGKNLLPMKELKALLENTGFKSVKTYIQSGNIVLMSIKKPQNDVGALINKKFGFTPEILALSEKEFKASVANNPYQEYEGKFVHVYFCQTKPKLNIEKLEKLISETERYEIIGSVFYLHAPDGIARSKLVANIESCLGVSATGRNLNTVNKLKEMVNNA